MAAYRALLRGLSIAGLLCWVAAGRTQGNQRPEESTPEFRLELPVDEVVLTFHAEDAQGLPVNDVKKDEIKLWDNGLAPRRIVAFDSLLDRQMRVGFLLDTSESMERTVAASRRIAEEFAQRVFRQKSDQAFVMDFGYESEIAVPWTANAAAVMRGIGNVRQGRMNPLAGTALVDTIFRACFHEFGRADATATANVLLVFSDGEDNASHTSVEEALGACQKSNTAIYAFRVPAGSEDSGGPKMLAELTAKSGGRVFPADDGEAAIARDLRTIESEARNEYRLVYDPARLDHDGAFHEIEIQPPDRVERVYVRTGYYAPRK